MVWSYSHSLTANGTRIVGTNQEGNDSYLLLLLLLSAFPIRGRHSGFSFSSCFYQLYLPPSLQPQPCPLHHIHKPPFWPTPFPLSWQLHPQHPSPNIPIIFPLYMSISPQSSSRVFSPNFPTCAVPLMYSFLILSILVTPNENRNIFNSATSISASCLLLMIVIQSSNNVTQNLTINSQTIICQL